MSDENCIAKQLLEHTKAAGSRYPVFPEGVVGKLMTTYSNDKPSHNAVVFADGSELTLGFDGSLFWGQGEWVEEPITRPRLVYNDELRQVVETRLNKHFYDLLTPVTIEPSEDDPWLQSQSPEIQHVVNAGLPLYIIKHEWDCDGTPLYILSLMPIDVPAGANAFDYVRESFTTELASLNQAVSLLKRIQDFVIRGIPGDSLRPFHIPA